MTTIQLSEISVGECVEKDIWAVSLVAHPSGHQEKCPSNKKNTRSRSVFYFTCKIRHPSITAELYDINLPRVLPQEWQAACLYQSSLWGRGKERYMWERSDCSWIKHSSTRWLNPETSKQTGGISLDIFGFNLFSKWTYVNGFESELVPRKHTTNPIQQHDILIQRWARIKLKRVRVRPLHMEPGLSYGVYWQHTCLLWL